MSYDTYHTCTKRRCRGNSRDTPLDHADVVVEERPATWRATSASMNGVRERKLQTQPLHITQQLCTHTISCVTPATARLMAQICGASTLSLLRLDVISFKILSGACFRATAAVTMSSSLGHRCGAMQCTNATHKARTRMKDCAERSAGRSLSHVREMITRRQTKPAETG